MLERVLRAVLHDLVVRVQEVVAAHPRLAGDAGGDHHHVGAGGVLVVVGADDPGVGALDRGRFHDVEALALGHALDDVDEDHVGQLAVGQPLRQGRPHVARAHHGDFPVHVLSLSSLCRAILPRERFRHRMPGRAKEALIEMAYTHAKVPAAGAKITIKDGKLRSPTSRSCPSSRATAPAPTSGGPASACSTPRWPRPTAASGRSQWMEVYAGQKSFDKLGSTGCPTRRSTAFREFLVGIKGPLTTPDRRRHPLPERGPAPDARPLRLPAARALVQGRALARAPPRAGGHGDLPREHRGHLRRHRVRETARADVEEGPRVPEDHLPEGCTRRSASPRARPSASSRCPARAPSGWCAPPSATPSRTSARA